MKRILLAASSVVAIWFSACTSKTSTESSIPADSVTVARGMLTFTENCGSCHSFEAEGIGPQLNGITGVVSVDWLKKFIGNPTALIDAGDERARRLYEKYKTIMPSFAHLPEDKINDLIAFIHSQKVQKGKEPEDPYALKDPLPAGIEQSTLVVELKKVVEIPASSEEGPRTRLNTIGYQPKSDKLFVLDHRGKLYVIENNKPVVYMDIAAVKPNFIHKPGLATGFGSFAFHPEFDKNGLFYTSNAEPKGTKKADFFYNDSIPVQLQWVITEWTSKTPGSVPYQGEPRELLRIDMQSQIHGMQELAFNPLAKPGDEDYGLLYVGIGDGGAVEHGFPLIANSMERLWGKVIRIDPRGNNSANKQYGIPPTNPYAKSTDGKIAPEIFASGFRNPHRISWTKSGLIITSNVGHGNLESVYVLQPGNNYGWPIREGSFLHKEYGNMNAVYPLAPDDSTSGITYPIAEYDHDEGKAVSGGYEYWGKSVPALEGKYLFGDMNFGRLYYINTRDITPGKLTTIKEWRVTVDGKPTTMAELCGNKRVDLRLGRDKQGEMYVFTKPGGVVYKMISAKE